MSSHLLHWLPALSDADAAFAAVKATVEPAARLAAIVALAGHQLDFVQTGKLDRLLERTLAELPQPGMPVLRVAWPGSSTLDHLLPPARSERA